MTYYIAIWGNCNKLDLYCRAGRLIFNLPRDTPSVQVMELVQWNSIYDVYKRSLIKLIYNIASDNMPAMISDLVERCTSRYNLRGYYKAVVPRFFTCFIKTSVCDKGAVLWNCVSEYYNDSCNLKQFYLKAKSSPIFKEIRFARKKS